MKTLILVIALLLLPIAAQGDICISGDRVTLSGPECTDANGIAGYELWRGASEADRVLLNPTTLWPAYLMEDRPPEGSHTYWVRAVDNCGNRSAFSGPSVEVRIDRTPPTTPTVPTVTVTP
jgi:hypothetical protein